METIESFLLQFRPCFEDFIAIYRVWTPPPPPPPFKLEEGGGELGELENLEVAYES